MIPYCFRQNILAMVVCQLLSNYHVHNNAIWSHNVECDDVSATSMFGVTSSVIVHLLLFASKCITGSEMLLSSAAKPGTHVLENNKIIGVFTMLKLCMSKERLAQQRYV